MNIIGETISLLSLDTLFSTIITLYTLLILYSPCIFLKYIFSPVTLSTLILLLYLVRLGATQKHYSNSAQSQTQDELQPIYAESSFVEWDVRAPLEVIHELEFEDDDSRHSDMDCIQKYASLSRFYPESDDSDVSSEDGDWDSPEHMCFRWEEDDREGFIEIALDDEDNLIEIHLSPPR